MNDEYLEFFLSKFGEPTERVEATKEQIEAYRGVLPEKLLEYWSVLGFSGFRDGLFWITNPADFDDVLDCFLKDTEFADYDNYHVIARSAYGKLYLWGERTGDSLEITPHLNWIETNEGMESDIRCGKENFAIQLFLSLKKEKYIDVNVGSNSVFQYALGKFGSVGCDEVIVFTPYLFVRGEKALGNIAKENLHVFLQIVADMGGAEVVDMASMVSNVLKQHGE